MSWFKLRRGGDIPEYSAVRKTPNRELPPELAEREASPEYRAQRESIESSLRKPPWRPEVDTPLFVELLAVGQQGVLTITLPDNVSRCLPVFSSPYRAADYIRTQLPHGTAVSYLSSSPLELVAMLRDLKAVGIEQFTLDRCPRCNIFPSLASSEIVTPEDAINCWAISKSMELARLDLYLNHASASARAGDLSGARDVAYETVAHVSLEDPRARYLLGQIAIALNDRNALREAKAFLQFCQFNSWERRLDEAARSGSTDFEIPARFDSLPGNY